MDCRSNFYQAVCGAIRYIKEEQYSPNYFHRYKTEDTINRGGEADAITVDPQKYLKVDAQAKLLYPNELPTKYQLCNRKLTVRLDAPYSARLFELFSANLEDKQ